MGALRRSARRLSAALAAFLLLTLAAVLAPQAAQAQQSCGALLSTPTVTTASGVKQLTVSWGALSTGQNSVGSWELRYRKMGATNWITRTIPGASVRSIVISGLKTATTYQVQLKAIHQTGICPPSNFSAIATGTTISAPALTATAGDRQVTLNWTYAGTGHTSWAYIQKKGASLTRQVNISSSNAATRSYTVTGLDNGSAYRFSVLPKARNGAVIAGPQSNIVTATPMAAPPVLISDADKSVTLPSGQSTVAVCYNLQAVSYDGTTYLETRDGRTAVPAHSSLSDATNGVEITAAPTGITTGRNVNLSPCASLGVGTHTVTWEWNGPDGDASKGTTSTTVTVVEAPSTKTFTLSATSTRITEGNSGHTDVTITITLGEPAPEDFTALISGAGDPGTATEPTKSQDACEPPLQPADTDWCFLLDSAAVAIAEGETEETVKIRILGDTRDESNETIILHVSSEEPGWTRDATLTLTIVDDDGVTSPAAPPGFRASAGNGQVTLNWNDPNDATITGYKLVYAKTGDRGSASWAPIPGSGIRTLTYTVRNLDNDAEYSFRVRAVNSAGDGTATTWVTATPTGGVTCPTAQPPTALSVTPGSDRLSLTWTAPTQAERNGWQLQYRKTGGSWTAVTISSAGATGYTISGLEAGTAYQVRLQATVGEQGASCPASAFATAAGTTTGSVSTTPTTSTPIYTPPPGTPRADAGPEIEAAPGAVVTLDGSGSTDPDGGELRYSWRQVLGWSGIYRTAVALEGADTARPSFTAPAGPYTLDILVFRLTVTDPEGKTDTASVWVTVGDAAPVFGDASVTALELAEDAAMAAVALPEATGGNGALTYTLTSAPTGLAGLVFDPETRRLSGTPPESGSWTFTYRADDADSNRSETDAAILTFTVTVRDEAPTFGDASVSALALTGDEAMAPVVLPEATGGNGALTYTLTSVPQGLAGLAFDPETRQLSGTPPTESGSWTFTYRADDADGNRTEADAAILTFMVTVRDEAPVFGDASVPALALTGDEAMTAVTLPEATGGNGDLSYTLTSTPTGLAGLMFDPATRRLSGTPSAGGSWTFTLRADDADSNRDKADAAILTFTVTVRDEAPTFGGASVPALALAEDAAMTAVVLPEATGGNGALSYTLTSAPAGLAGLAFDRETRRLSGTPPESGSWTFTWRADDADANRSETDAAILTFAVRVEDARTALVKQTVRRTLAAVARRALTGALDNIGARMAAEAPMSGLILAGETVPLAVSGAGTSLAGGACAAGDSWRHGLDWPGPGTGLGAATADCGGSASRTVGSDELLNASAFSLGLGAAEDEAGFDPRAPRWAVWGRGDYGTFAGHPDGMRYDGEMRTGWLGIDARAGAWVAGLAVSHGTGEADYGLDGGETGRLETELTAVYPYGRWTVSEGLELRGVLGAGWGEARHRLEDGAEEAGDLSMRMASLGLRHALPPLAGIDLAARADASVARMETDEGPDPVHGLTADSWRLRAGVEASRRFALDDATSLTPFVEAAARRDGGDGLTGTGLEVAGGVRWTAPRVQVEARGRWLAAHTEDGAEEKGVSVTARVGPGAQGRGLSLMLSPRWGAEAGGAEALWRDALPAASAADSAAALDARIGYGLGLTPWGLLTPFAETGLAGNDSRRLRLGTRFDAHHGAMAVELAGEHREGSASGPEQTIRLDLKLRF